MVILDTNVISEITRTRPAPPFTDWIDRQRIDDLFTTTVSEAEIHAGLHNLTPDHPRFPKLQAAATHLFNTVLRNRILPFDRAAAAAYGPLWAQRRHAGLATSVADLQIAAIAHVHRMAVATRNVADFSETGIELINPWDHRRPG